jgi:hypothetical protein
VGRSRSWSQRCLGATGAHGSGGGGGRNSSNNSAAIQQLKCSTSRVNWPPCIEPRPAASPLAEWLGEGKEVQAAPDTQQAAATGVEGGLVLAAGVQRRCHTARGSHAAAVVVQYDPARRPHSGAPPLAHSPPTGQGWLPKTGGDARLDAVAQSFATLRTLSCHYTGWPICVHQGFDVRAACLHGSDVSPY